MLYLAFALQYDQFDYCEDANAQERSGQPTLHKTRQMKTPIHQQNSIPITRFAKFDFPTQR